MIASTLDERSWNVRHFLPLCLPLSLNAHCLLEGRTAAHSWRFEWNATYRLPATGLTVAPRCHVTLTSQAGLEGGSSLINYQRLHLKFSDRGRFGTALHCTAATMSNADSTSVASRIVNYLSLIFYAVILLVTLSTLTATFTNHLLFPLQTNDLEWSNAWLLETVIDYYGTCLCFCGVVVASEDTWRSAILWVIACLTVKSPACCLYVFLWLTKEGGSLRLERRSKGLPTSIQAPPTTTTSSEKNAADDTTVDSESPKQQQQATTAHLPFSSVTQQMPPRYHAQPMTQLHQFRHQGYYRHQHVHAHAQKNAERPVLS